MTKGQFNKLLLKNNQTRKKIKNNKGYIKHNISEKTTNIKKQINLKTKTLKSYK